MKLFIDIVMKRIYLFNIVAWNYRKKIGFPVCTKENFAGLQAHRKRGKSSRASPTPHHTLNEERSARFTAQHLSALLTTAYSSAIALAAILKTRSARPLGLALYSTYQNHIDREGLRLNFGHLVTCYTNERCLRCFDVFAPRGFAFLLLWALLYLGDRVLANKEWI